MGTLPSSLSKTIRIDVLPRLTNPASGGVEQLSSSSATVAPSRIRPEAYFRFFENAYDATLITDQKGAYVNANRRVSELLGYSTQTLRKLNFWQLISGADAGLMETVRQSLASERFLRISAWCVRQDGSSFPAEIAVNQSVSDNSTFFCFFIRDETLRTRAEAQLRTVQNAVKNADTGIGVAALDGVILYANTALAALFNENDALRLQGRHLDTLLGNTNLAPQLAATVESGQSALVEVSLPLADGTTQWIQISAAPNLDAENALIGMVLSLVDITDRRRAEQAKWVVERDRVMMESLGAVCHHLGQPATVLLSTLEMINRLKESDVKARNELLQMSMEAAEALRKTLLELNDLRHYHAENYPGTTAEQATRIVAFPPPVAGT